MSEANLAMFEIDADSFVKRFLTQEGWVHHLKTRDQKTIHAVQALDLCSKEGQGGAIGTGGDGLRLLGYERRCVYRLPLKK